MPTSLLNMLQSAQVTVGDDSEVYLLLSRLVTDDDPVGEAHLTNPGSPIDFVVLQERVSFQVAQHINEGNTAPHAIWRLPHSLHYNFTPPTPQGLFKLELTLDSVSVALPFLQGASVDASNLLSPLAQAVSITLPQVTLIITPDSPDDQAPAILLSVPDQLVDVLPMTPAHAFIGEGNMLGFGFEQGVFRVSDTGEPMVDIAEAQVFLAIPDLPFLAIQAPNEHLLLGLGSEPGVSAEWRIDAATVGVALPKFLRDLTWYVRVNQNSIVSYEVAGKVHFPSALPLVGADGGIGGLVDFSLLTAYDFTIKDVRLSLTFKANPGYLWRVQKGDSIPDMLRNTLGAFAVFGPLLDGQSGTREPGQVVGIALATNMVTGFAGNILTTESVTLHSMELLKPAGTAEYSLLFDCETELSLQAGIGGFSLQSTRPMKVRHKALGVRLDFAGTQPTFHPVFDSSRGYTFDVSDPGLLQIPGPLGDILHVLGARMARNNPLNFELDLGIKADLGVVSVERTSVRIPISPFGVPTITALGAHITIPGAIDGHGYLSIDKAGFAGKLDLSLVPLAVRLAGGLAVESVPGATAVLVTMEVDFPVPILLYSSGLGLYGVLGLFGMHYMRDQQGNETALNWFERIGGNAIQIHPGWRSAVDQWAFGIGAVLGTMEGGFILNLKGVVVIELPGPRLLLLMKADLLSQKPQTQGVDGGTILAAIEVSPDAISIGFVVEFKKASPLLEIRIPANAHFPFKPPENFELDLGTFIDPATVKFLIGFRASGYLMIHGNGIPTQGVTVPNLATVFPIGPLLGYAIAAGVRASFTWGVEEIGLYARVATQVDIGVSFNPFLIVGKMVLSGELHLFIAGVEVTASADVIIRSESEYYIHAILSGRIRFWPLPAIEDHVTIELGSPIELPPAPSLVRALSLHSRPPAVLLGNNTDRAIDGSLCDATQDGSVPRKIDSDGQAHEVLVPIDSIPVLQFEMPPCIDKNCKPLGQSLSSPVTTLVNGWVRRGERFYRYTVTAIDWSSGVGEGEKPLTWWRRKSQTNGADIQLSFLNWIPQAAPTAVPRSINQQDAVKERWGSICSPVAEPTSVLWTFNAAPLGSSETGWTLQGMVGPDKVGTYRSTPPPSRLHVTEQWRTGYSLIDALLAVDPALIIGPNTQMLGRILRSPFSEGELHTNVREGTVAEIVQLALQERQQQGTPLYNAILLHTGTLDRIRLLLQVPSRLLPLDLLVLRACAADGTPLGDDMLVDGRVINPATDLPPTWSSGPWSADVQKAIAQRDTALQQALHMETSYVLFEQELPEGTEQLELGIRAPEHLDEFLLQFLRYWVIGVEGWPLAERMRYDYDMETRSHNIKTVDGALRADSANLALLKPNTLYTVSVNYKVEVGEEYQADEKPEKGSEQGENSRGQMVPIKKVGEATPADVPSFTFKTDNAPPTRIDPWVLCMNPTPGDQFHFWGDPIVVTLQTGAVRKLFAAYARSLRGIVRAASGRHSVNEPTHPNTFAALNEQVAHSLDIPFATTATPTTPWKQAMVEVMADSCVDIQGATEHHELIVLPLLLDAQTDYIFDIVTEQAPSVPLFRRSFTTSRYRTVQEMASHIAGMQVAHRWIANAAPLHDLLAAIAPRVPDGQGIQLADQEIEQTLLHSGWGGIAVPQEPSIVVIWQDGGAAQPPQPVALLIDSPEPLWRWRQVPHEIMDAERPDRVKWWRLQDTLWLELIEAPTEGAIVSRFAYNQGGARTLVLLKPNARGGRLNVSLKKTPHHLLDTDMNGLTLPLIVANLEAAPWEEQE